MTWIRHAARDQQGQLSILRHPPTTLHLRERKSPVAGKNQLGQQIRQKSGKSNIPTPDHRGQSSHQTNTSSFESVAEVKPGKSWLKQWFGSWFPDSKVEATVTSPKLPSKPEQTTDFETGSTSKDSTELAKRTIEEVETSSGGFWQALTSIPSWLNGKKVESAKLERAVIPQAERDETHKPSTFTRAINFVASAVRMADTATLGTISELAGTTKDVGEGLVGFFTGKDFAGHTKQFLAHKGTSFPSINDLEFQMMFGNIARLLASDPNQLDSEFQTIEIPTIEIDQGLITPLRVKGLKFRARLAPYPKDCSMIQKQQFQRAIEIEDLQCTVDLPRADQMPATLDISLPNGTLSIGSNIASAPGITDIGRLILSSDNASLPFDHTAIQIKADNLRVGFKKLNSATPFDPSAPTSLEAPGVLGFNDGAAEFKDICIATPLSLLRKAPDQTTVFQCGGFKLTNEISRDVMVNMRTIDVSSLDPQLCGPLKLDIGLDIRKVRNFPGASFIPKFLLNAQIDCEVSAELNKGELDFKKLKSGIKFKSAGTNWWSRKLTDWLNEIISSDKTTLVTGKDGKPKIRFFIPNPLKKIFGSIPLLGRIIPTELSIPLELSLPIKGLCPSPDNQGKVVVVDLLSNVVQGLLMGWFQIPGKAQLVQKDHELLCTAAASGNITVSKALTTIAGELESSGHSGQALRIWQAIPTSHFAQISLEDTQLSSEIINTMAHRMVEVDPDKAIALYGLALKGTPVGPLPENYDAEAVMTAAQRLDLTKPNEKAVALDVLEFLAMARPQGSAFAKLNQLFRSGQYPQARISGLLAKVIHLPPYADNLSHQASLLEEMEPSMGDAITEALINLPTHALTRQYGISAEETAAHFEPLMLKYHQEVQAARMYQNIHNAAKAGKILEDCIKQDDEGASAALKERLTSEVFHGSYGTPRYISGFQLLMDLDRKTLSPKLEQTRQHMLKILWRETRNQSIKWPGLSTEQETSTPAAQYQNAAARLFSIPEKDADSPDKLFETLSGIHRDMTEARGALPPSDQGLAQLLQFEQLVNSLMVETRMHMEALRFMEAEQPAQRTHGQQKKNP